MMDEFSLLNEEFSGDIFEEQSNENGFTYWLSGRLMDLLGYRSRPSFEKAVNKAMTTCNTLNIPIFENFIEVISEVNGKIVRDFKLSRFACYLVVMNADNKNKKVAQAQAYFAMLAGAVTHYIEEANKIDRLVIREDVSERESSLSGVVKRAGIENYAYFQSAGYRGMYNMNISMLRNIPDRKSPLDFMGKDELAANLFRITQTELKIKNDNIRGQSKLEITAENVGKEVRNTMIKISGVAPEHFQKEKDLNEVKKELKSKSRTIKQIDSAGKRFKKPGIEQMILNNNRTIFAHIPEIIDQFSII
jgi:DNA-damage-inducible protein D